MHELKISYDATIWCRDDKMELQRGIYQHYKGNLYQVFNVATHSETGEKLVVYQCLYGDYSLWVRPLAMFTETITTADDREMERFKLIQETV